MRLRWQALLLAAVVAACATSRPSPSTEVTEQMSSWVGQEVSVAVEAWGQPQWRVAAKKASRKWGPGELAAHDPNDGEALVWLFDGPAATLPCDPFHRPYRDTYIPELGRHTGVLDGYVYPCNMSRVVWADGHGVIYNWRAD